MRLTTDADPPIDQPTPDDIRRVVSFSDHPRRTFAILQDRPGFYIQVAIDDHRNYQVEYQDGTLDRHYEAYVVEHHDDDAHPGLGEVVAAFVSYLRGDDEWRRQFRWTKLEL